VQVDGLSRVLDTAAAILDQDRAQPRAPAAEGGAATDSSMGEGAPSPVARWSEWVHATGELAEEVTRIHSGGAGDAGETATSLPRLTAAVRRCTRARGRWEDRPSAGALERRLAELLAEAERLQNALFPPPQGANGLAAKHNASLDATDHRAALQTVLQQVEEVKDALLAVELMTA